MTIRDVQLRVLEDCETSTHNCVKGAIVTMASNIAQPFIDAGKLEVVREQASAAPKSEKRG